MAQYINKSDLVAEIENLENRYKKCQTRNSYEKGLKDGRLIGYKDALYKINTLEVKEIDLSWKDIRLIAEIGEEWLNSEESDAYADDDEGYYTAILNKVKEKGLNYKTQRQRIRDIQAQKGE